MKYFIFKMTSGMQNNHPWPKRKNEMGMQLTALPKYNVHSFHATPKKCLAISFEPI
jgi:hypothetical protein